MSAPAHRVMLRFAQVSARAGLGRTTIYALIAADEFPAPVKIGTASRWFEDEIDAWMAARAATRAAPTGDENMGQDMGMAAAA